MKITIDTKEDSHEDIRKVIRMLRSLIGENGAESEIVKQPSPSGNELNNLMSMFDEPANYNDSYSNDYNDINKETVADAEDKKEEDLGVTFY